MAKKPKTNKRKPRHDAAALEIDPVTGEDRRAEAVTVAWMLSMLATTAADVMAMAMFAFLPLIFAEAGGEEGMSPLVFPRLLLLIAACTGTVCVILTPLVYRFRRVPPPPVVTLFGLIVGIAPVVGLFWMSVSR